MAFGELIKLDPTGALLRDFVAFNEPRSRAVSDDDRARIGVHTCPGGDQDSTHSADVDYAMLLPGLFGLRAGHFSSSSRASRTAHGCSA